MDLNREVQKIRSREDLVSFVRSLADDSKNHSRDWENDNLETYLYALAAWIEDMDGYYQNVGEKLPEYPNWRTLGQMLLAAKIYE